MNWENHTYSQAFLQELSLAFDTFLFTMDGDYPGELQWGESKNGEPCVRIDFNENLLDFSLASSPVQQWIETSIYMLKIKKKLK